MTTVVKCTPYKVLIISSFYQYFIKVSTFFGLVSGSLVSMRKKEQIVPRALKHSRWGFVIGIGLTPFLVEGTLYSTNTRTPEGIYERVYRIHYHRNQIRSACWSTYIPLATAAAGAYMAKPPPPPPPHEATGSGQWLRSGLCCSHGVIGGCTY